MSWCIELSDELLHKPVNPVLFKARIGSSLEKKRLRDLQRDMVRRFATSQRWRRTCPASPGFALGGRSHPPGAAMFSRTFAVASMVESQTPEETIEL